MILLGDSVKYQVFYLWPFYPGKIRRRDTEILRQAILSWSTLPVSLRNQLQSAVSNSS